jgi:phosphatidylinositol glycan class V
MATPTERSRGHRKILVFIFLIWKTLLLTLAAFCPGPGYDTSGLIVVDPSVTRHKNFSHLPWLDRLTLKLFRWDALYFIKGAQRGKLHEQEWAFSWAYSCILRSVGQCKWTKLLLRRHC